MTEDLELSPEAKKARADYVKAWKAAHPNAQKRYIKKFWEKKAKEAAEAEKEA